MKTNGECSSDVIGVAAAEGTGGECGGGVVVCVEVHVDTTAFRRAAGSEVASRECKRVCV